VGAGNAAVLEFLPGLAALAATLHVGTLTEGSALRPRRPNGFRFIRP
jgi:hypothetical protein